MVYANLKFLPTRPNNTECLDDLLERSWAWHDWQFVVDFACIAINFTRATIHFPSPSELPTCSRVVLEQEREGGRREREREREEDRERRDKLMTSCHAANEINPDVCFLAHEQTHLIYYFETVKRVIWPILKEKVCKSFSFEVGDDFSDFDDKFKG